MSAKVICFATAATAITGRPAHEFLPPTLCFMTPPESDLYEVTIRHQRHNHRVLGKVCSPPAPDAAAGAGVDQTFLKAEPQ